MQDPTQTNQPVPPLQDIPLLAQLALTGLRTKLANHNNLLNVIEQLSHHFTIRCWKAVQEAPDSLSARELVYWDGWAKIGKAAGIDPLDWSLIPHAIVVMYNWMGEDGNQPSLLYDFVTTEPWGALPMKITITVGKGLVPGPSAKEAPVRSSQHRRRIAA